MEIIIMACIMAYIMLRFDKIHNDYMVMTEILMSLPKLVILSIIRIKLLIKSLPVKISSILIEVLPFKIARPIVEILLKLNEKLNKK